MSEEFKIMPTEGSTIVTIAPGLTLTGSALSTLGRSKYHRWESPNDPSKNTSNYDIFKTTESCPMYILGLRISDFPLKNAPCKNAHPLSLPFRALCLYFSFCAPLALIFSSLVAFF